MRTVFNTPIFFHICPLMVVERYIGELLYRYNCVVVPNFGAFLANKIPARANTSTHTFAPPTKSISFNEQLTSNDGLLVTHIAQAEKIAYDAALQHLQNEIGDWKIQLNKGEKLLLPKIGDLWTNGQGKIQFQPTQHTNYLASSFGLSNFTAVPITREILREEVAVLEENIPFVISPEHKETRGLRPYYKYAAILLLAFATGLTGFRLYQQNLTKQQAARQDAHEMVTKQIQEATFFDSAPIELPTVTINAMPSFSETAETKKHHIIAGAFRVKANAERKIAQLKEKGYHATYYGTNAYGLHMVSYESYNDPQEALNALHTIKRTESQDAWMLSEK